MKQFVHSSYTGKDVITDHVAESKRRDREEVDEVVKQKEGLNIRS